MKWKWNILQKIINLAKSPVLPNAYSHLSKKWSKTEWLMKNNLILHVISTSLSGSTKMKIMVLIHKRNDHLWFLTYDWHHEWKKDTALAWLIPTNTAIHLMTLDHSPLWESGLLIDRWRSRHGYRSPINTRKKIWTLFSSTCRSMITCMVNRQFPNGDKSVGVFSGSCSNSTHFHCTMLHKNNVLNYTIPSNMCITSNSNTVFKGDLSY